MLKFPAFSTPDARLFQSLGQGTILAVGLIVLGFEITPAQILVALGVCLAAQWLGSMLIAAPFDWRSAFITGFSLSLLMRAEGLWPMAFAAAVAIGSKFMLRLHGKHVFNPANAGIVAALLLTDSAWTSTGQWASTLWFALFIAGLGAVVAHRARRLDVPVVFLGTYGLFVLGRAAWLGDPLTIPLMHLQNGALILFAFFMISDPKTTPNGLKARTAFTAGAAALAYLLVYHFYIPDGMFYALAAACIVRPLIEVFDLAPRHEWRPPRFSELHRRDSAAPAE